MVEAENQGEKSHIRCKTIIEVLGKPKEHVENSLKEYTDHIREDSDLAILNENYSDIKEQDKLWSKFVELDLVIKDLEHKGDEIAYSIIDRLDKNFRTSINKGYIKQLTVLLDDILNLIDAVASRFVIFGIERVNDYILKLTDLIADAVDELNKTILGLQDLKNIKSKFQRIYELEKEADKIYGDALSDLFHYYKNPIDVIKYKEIYELLEGIADKCKDVMKLVKSVAIKQL